MKHLALAIALAAMLTGCATITAHGVGAFSNENNGYPVSIERGGVFYKNSPITIYVDGKEAAVLGGRQAITIHVPAGRHIVAASPVNKAMKKEIVIDVSATKHPIIRTNLQIGGPRLEVINE